MKIQIRPITIITKRFTKLWQLKQIKSSSGSRCRQS